VIEGVKGSNEYLKNISKLIAYLYDAGSGLEQKEN
jgi:hypothetical protein